MPHKTVAQTEIDKLPGALISREPHLARLTPKQAIFVREYVAGGFNGTAAALAAGYSAQSKVSLSVRAWELVRNVKVRKALGVEISKHVEAIGWTKDSAIAMVHRIMMKAFEEENFAAALAAWGKLSDVTGVVTEMNDKTMTISFHSKAAALDDPANAIDVTPIARDGGESQAQPSDEPIDGV